MVLYFFFNFCNMTYFTNLSPKVIGEGIGDITALQAQLEADWKRFKENPTWMAL